MLKFLLENDFFLTITVLGFVFGIGLLVWVIRNKSVLAENAKLAHNNRVQAEQNRERAKALAEEAKRQAAA